MKSPVPFLKPQSYYTSPIRTNIVTDDTVNQVDPAPIAEVQSKPEIKVIMSGEPSLDAMVEETKPKAKKSK